MKVLVLGGNGFVGRAICREGVRRGWSVTSLSRSGAPENINEDDLLSKVQWKSGSALDPLIYQTLMKGQDCVIHSIGILFEPRSQEPLAYERTYKALIRDTAEVAANEAIKCGVKTFGYVSAAKYGSLGKVMLPTYMDMKGQAEDLLLAKKEELRSVIVRPGFIYGGERSATVPMSYAMSLVTLFTAGYFPKPLPVEDVAKALLNEVSKPSTDPSVVLEVSDISKSVLQLQ